MTDMDSWQGGPSRSMTMVFPGDTNHHGTLFGGVALAHMDRVAFIAASRHGRVPFVTAASERIDFIAPAHEGDLVDAVACVVRVGRRSLDVDVELFVEMLLTGERKLCTKGRFTLVAKDVPEGFVLPALTATDD
ncbi:acyl-CoA thioesterase [uncultured Algimonas sp.]|uniref:acyl-CoA thioesterase n=1 Tax=uncultured Algimonas sp. TaxID=1547920 RepID=UPI0026189BE4|nr:acyl-CoA thioesterase [uncultured Algimonas sp.]